ncbi:hypothetical protein J6590_001982 [Homalodisca vitripennis]|nr:hypothetical protein J6590_001982 [Homalodisca vitripennis]
MQHMSGSVTVGARPRGADDGMGLNVVVRRTAQKFMGRPGRGAAQRSLNLCLSLRQDCRVPMEQILILLGLPLSCLNVIVTRSQPFSVFLLTLPHPRQNVGWGATRLFKFYLTYFIHPRS